MLTRSKAKLQSTESKISTRTISTQTDLDNEHNKKRKENDIDVNNDKQPINIIINNYQQRQEQSKRQKISHDDDYNLNDEDEDDEDDDEDEDDEDEDDDDEDDKIIIKIKGLSGDKDNVVDHEDEFDINEHVLKKIDDKDLNTLLASEKKYKNNADKIVTKFVSNSSINDLKYYKTLSQEEKIKFAETQKRIENMNNDSEPLKFKLLDKNFDDNTKAIIFKKLAIMNTMCPINGEYHKLKNWINAVCNIPFSKVKELPVRLEDGQDKIVEFMKKTKDDFDNKIYGHIEAKDQITRIIAQWISNPTSKGNVIGIHGKPGVGKTTLIKDGLAKTLNLPFAFVPLGGAHDSSFLDGHGFTYEGSTWGKIAELLMHSKYMNPIIYFDELDKISDTTKGQEIINVLIHLTDPSQNDKFNDKYFSEIPLDLSKALIIFTYNDDTMISPILKDRMIRIETKDYTTSDKVNISKNHMLPEIMSQFGIKEGDIEFNDDILIKLINNTIPEAGVRNLKRNIESIVSNINLNVLLGKMEYPVCIDSEIIDTYKQKTKDVNPSIPHMYL
tara:strand:- start:2309 stop:3979 length:1671 start_codon:yes stop_codon:yes gene_type:complete